MRAKRVVAVVWAIMASMALALPASGQLLSNELLLPPRALAMGGASTGMRNELEVSLGNPAGLSQLRRSGLAGAAAIAGDIDFVGAGVFGVSSTRERQYAFTLLDIEDDQLGSNSTVVGGTISYDAGERLSVGTTIKWLFNNPSGGDSNDYLTADVGFQYRVSPESERCAIVGAVISNIFNETSAGIDPGTQFAFGAQGELSDKVLIAADVADLFNAGPGGAIFRAGVEVEFGDNILIRAGVNEGDSSVGAAFESGKARIEVGWRPDTGVRDDIVTVGASSTF
ncbi:MAG: hypothetical protein PVH68_08810 [Armatimonadota bacterium]|jgi:hypothetical protein